LLLAGYEKDFHIKLNRNTVKKRELKSIQHERSILLSENLVVFYSFNTFRSTDNFWNAAKNLERLNLGKIAKEKRDSSTRDSSCFKKTNFYSFNRENRFIFLNNISDFQVDSAKYIEQFNHLKRSNSNSLISESKKKLDEKLEESQKNPTEGESGLKSCFSVSTSNF
jgi:hypothetical protein